MTGKPIRQALILAITLFLPTALVAQKQEPQLKLETGQQIFEATCIGCHGSGGKGLPESTLGFEHPPTYPDFSDCVGSAREKNYDWRSVLHEGGPARGFSEIMPSFAEALTLEQIERVMQYLREQCTDKAWPRGEMNFPRPLVTEKAFPEDEYLLTTAVNAKAPHDVTLSLFSERRFGARNQLEFVVPVSFINRDRTNWIGGIGDFVLGYKRVLFSSIETGSIFSLQGEVSLPTGNRLRGLGSGVTTFEPFAAFGQMLPGRSFVQIQSGAELPADTDKAQRAAFFRTAVGKTFAANRGFGRIWTPMVEVLVDREFESGARTNWDLVPQMQVSLSRRQHVFFNFGVRTPANNRTGRDTQLMFYVLWDWFDGGLREGW